jgi:hypothetical protein
MAGKNTYIGLIFQSMIDKLDSMITNLQTLSTSLSQSISGLFVAAGTQNQIICTSTAFFQVTGNGTDGAVKTSIGKTKFFCSGSITLSVYLYEAAASAHGGLWTNKNSAGWVKTITCATGTGTYEANIPVANGDVIEFALGGNQNAVVVSTSGGITMKYDVKNIITQGPFALV